MTTSTPAGWYDDPANPNAQRYWDGQNWTPHYQRKASSMPSSAPNLPPPQPTPVSNVPPPPPPPPNQQAPWLPPGHQPAGSSRKIVASIASVAMVALAIFGTRLAIHYFNTGTHSSPEDQIRAVVQHEADNFNNSNFSYSPELMCKAQAAHGSDEQYVENQRTVRAQGGTVSVSVTNIHVTGDQATADLTAKFAKIPDKPVSNALQFVKEDGRWKDCTPDQPEETTQ